MSKRILFIHPAIRPYRQKLFELLSQNYNTKFIFTEDYNHNLQYLKETKIKSWQVYKSHPFLFYSKGVNFEILKLLFSENYDILIASGLYAFSTHLAFLLTKIKRKKFILFSEDWWFPKLPKTYLFLPFAKFLIKKVDAVIAAGNRAKNFFLKFGASPQKIFLAVNATEDYEKIAINKEKLKFLRKELGLEGKFVILYLGRIVRYKGLDILIKAFSRLEREKENAFLLIVGEGNFKADCLSLAQQLKIQNIKFEKSVVPKEAPYYYQLANVFVLPARFIFSEMVLAEAWGFTINEALSCGLPVITTEAVAAADDLIKEGQNGFKIRTEDDFELYQKLKLLIDNRSLAEKMGLEAKKIMREFTPQNQFDSFSKALNYLDD